MSIFDHLHICMENIQCQETFMVLNLNCGFIPFMQEMMIQNFLMLHYIQNFNKIVTSTLIK